MEKLSKNGVKWSREETVIALMLYHQITFSKINQNHKDIRLFARLLGRTPGSIGLKMCNLAACDEELKSRGIKSMGNGSRLDKEIWKEFKGDYVSLAAAYTKALEKLGIKNIIYPNKEISTFELFRQTIFTSYAERCCMTGIALPNLLDISYIKPWQFESDKERFDPENGICLNGLYKKAFDYGYISINKNSLRIMISDSLKKHSKLDTTTKDWILSRENNEIILPERYLPATEFLEYHNDCIFKF